MPACASSGVYAARDTHGCDAAALAFDVLRVHAVVLREVGVREPGADEGLLADSSSLVAETHRRRESDPPRARALARAVAGGVDRAGSAAADESLDGVAWVGPPLGGGVRFISLEYTQEIAAHLARGKPQQWIAAEEECIAGATSGRA